MTNRQPLLHALLLSLLLTLSQWAAADDATRAALFAAADAALQAANANEANVLAPDHYQRAAQAYKRAEDRLAKGQSLEKIRSDLSDAARDFNAAADATDLARRILASSIGARRDALAARAEQFTKDRWKRAEETFSEAASKLEGGNTKAAEKLGAQAQSEYSAAELDAIKANYLADARELLNRAEREKVDRYAPQTLDKARQLLAQAETALAENRYDIDQPRAIAREAQAEARHAFYIAALAEPVARKKQSPEQLILQLEAPLIALASDLDIALVPDSATSSDPLRARVANLQQDSYDLSERNKQVALLEATVADLESQLGVQTERLAKQEARRKQFEGVQTLFLPDEATVLRHGEDIVVRLAGLSFESGQSAINGDNFGLLRKVQQAIALYPKAQVQVEGHTDSFGGDAANLQLSQARADAVKAYLTESMGAAAGGLSAEGFGEARPIANNETADGRRRNRRIDLVIKPQLR